MHVPLKARITLAIVVGIGTGTGALIYGHLLSDHESDRVALLAAAGAALLAASVSAFIAHLAGSFREIEDDREPPAARE